MNGDGVAGRMLLQRWRRRKLIRQLRLMQRAAEEAADATERLFTQ